MNDGYGHARGDECLREIARVLDEMPKRGHDVVARYGGEEFSVLLPGADSSGAMRIAEYIRSSVAALFTSIVEMRMAAAKSVRWTRLDANAGIAGRRDVCPVDRTRDMGDGGGVD